MTEICLIPEILNFKKNMTVIYLIPDDQKRKWLKLIRKMSRKKSLPLRRIQVEYRPRLPIIRYRRSFYNKGIFYLMLKKYLAFSDKNLLI